MYHPGFECDSPGERVSARGNGMLPCKFLHLRRHAMKRRDAVNIAITKEDDRLLCLTKPTRRLDKRVEHRLEVECRSADDLEHIGGSGLLLERFAKLAEQASVLNRNDCLMGEGFHQLDLLVGKWPRIPALQCEHADDCSFSRQRHSQSAATIEKTCEILPSARVEIRIGQQVRNMNCALFKNCASENRTSIRLRSVARKLIALLFGEPKSGNERICITFAPPDNAAVRFANAGCRFDQRIEHGLQVKGRTADDLEHVSGCRLLPERFTEFIE